MVRKKKYSYEKKIGIVKEIVKGTSTPGRQSKETGVSKKRIEEWVMQYESMGEEGLRREGKNKRYTTQIKEKAVKEYLSGKGSHLEICKKYEIRNTRQLRDWIKKYNGHERLKTTGVGGSIVTKGRKTSLEERIEIVKASIEQSHKYNEVAQAYNVSYQQVRSWTLKYEQNGIEALHDRRGKAKPIETMSETEKLKAEIKLEQAKNLRLQMENDLLKKLSELERWDG